MSEEKFQEWCILELMGHRRLAGLVTEVAIGGASFLRLDVPMLEDEEKMVTQFYSPAAVYCITPTIEKIARDVARRVRPEKVYPKILELPLLGSDDDVDYGWQDDDDYAPSY